MKKIVNAAAASVLAGAIVLGATPAGAAEAPAAAATTAASAATAAPNAAQATKPAKETLTWQERQERERAQIDLTSQRLDNAKKGLEVTNGIIDSAGGVKDLFTPRILKDGGLSTLLKIIGKLI